MLAPGRVAPWNGQIVLPDVARALLDSGVRDVVFVLAGENRSYRKYAPRGPRAGAGRKASHAVFRLTGHCRDMPAAFAAADVVVVPAIEAPVLGRVVAQAQAMGRPVVTTDVGVLPEHVVTPPEMPEDVRTGWVVKRGDADRLRPRARRGAVARRARPTGRCAARARQFAEYMFSPQSVAAATRAVYTLAAGARAS